MKILRIYNTLIRKKEPLKPIRKNWVGLYTCGPTIYNFAHIGNLRTYLFEDVLRRTIEYAGFPVRSVMNLTDVDDKIIRKAAQEGQDIYDFVKPYEKAFFEDVRKLNIKPAWKYPKATEHITDMVRLIQKLLKKEVAYQADGSVYFSIARFKNYGRLSRIATRQLKSGARNDSDEYTKQNVQDFALWKAQKGDEPFWDAPFGKGHPGWHIECSAMSMKYLGQTFDIHAGGIDLLFPHHENEIAQSEAATGKAFAHYFIEGEHLLINGEKMSKSLGNIVTLRDMEAKHMSPLAFRYLNLTSHYRSQLNFTWESVASAEQSLMRLFEFIRELLGKEQKSKRGGISLVSYRLCFEKAILNDLDTAKALASVWNIIHRFHKNPDVFDHKALYRLLCDFDKVLGLDLADIKSHLIPAEIFALTAKREEYRKNKQWQNADQVRDEIKKRGYLVEDSQEGPRLKAVPS